MTAGNGSMLNAVTAGDETSRLLLNAHMYEMGLGRYAISKEAWNAFRPPASLIKAIRNMPRRKKSEDE